MTLTSIITVNYNQPEVTIAFLNSVRECTENENVEVIVVDNGCREDFQLNFEQAYPGLIFIKSEKNLGFAGGNNLGVAVAKGDFLLFLNNDTEITPNLIPELSRELETNDEIGIVSPLLLYYDQPDIIQYAGYTGMNYITGRNSDLGRLQKNTGQYEQISRETGYCHGAAMMCRSADAKVIGLMDEFFFLYYEELDWCEKFKRAGKKIWFTGRTHVYHKESISVGKESSIKTYFMTRNRMLFIRRNTGMLNTMLFCLFFTLVSSPKQIFTYLKKGRKDLVKWVFKGVFWNITHGKNSSDLGFKL